MLFTYNWMLAGTCFTNMVKLMYLFFKCTSVIVETANAAQCAPLEREEFRS